MVVGVVSLVPQPPPWPEPRRSVRLRGMAVDPERRGEGIGRRLVEAAVARLRADHAEVLWANARDTAVGFYERMGWRVVGDGFVEIGIPHHAMVIELA